MSNPEVQPVSSNKTFLSKRSIAGLLTASLWLMIAATVTVCQMGCGANHANSGGDISTMAPALVGRATVSIAWPKPTRLIPDAAASIVVRIFKGSTVLASQTLARPAGGGTA